MDRPAPSTRVRLTAATETVNPIALMKTQEPAPAPLAQIRPATERWSSREAAPGNPFRNCGQVAPPVVPLTFAACHCAPHWLMTLWLLLQDPSGAAKGGSKRTLGPCDREAGRGVGGEMERSAPQRGLLEIEGRHRAAVRQLQEPAR